MRTISPEQFKKQYGDEALAKFGVPEKKPNYFQRVGKSLKETFTGLKTGLETQAETIAKEGFEEDPSQIKQATALGRGALRTVGATVRAAFIPLMEAPGVKQATEFVGEKLAETAPIQKFNEWAERHPEAAKDIMDTLDIAALFGGKAAKQPIEAGIKAGTKATGEIVEGGVKTLTEVGKKVGTKFAQTTQNAPSNIMNRIARLNPTDEVKFTKVAGKSPGQYLTDTGNFGSPQSIITKEAQKFVSSKNMVDEALAGLKGEFKVGQIKDILDDLIKKGIKVSTPSTKADFLGRTKELLTKHKTKGLNMSEINEVKRLFEREIKLGYNKTLNPDLVQKATNLDSALRKWQINKASELGFKNVAEMNKQTQISKFLVNKLGDKIVGQQALNNISLTDWVILAGGNPAAVSGFLVKKFFSSKAIQARIAKLLNIKEPQKLITPQIEK